MAALFDISDELPLLDRAEDDWSVEPESFFYCLQACGLLAVLVEVFEAERLDDGVILTGYGRKAIHEFLIRENKVMVGSQALADRHDHPIDHFYAGPADNPATWEGVIRHVFRNEKALLQLIDFRGRVKSEWAEYLRIRGDRLGF